MPARTGSGRRKGAIQRRPVEAVGTVKTKRDGRLKPRQGLRLFYNFRYSRSRRVCDRLTGISVAFASFILRM